MTRQRTILLSALLTLPVLLFVIHHYVSHGPGLHPTGFTNNENVLYVSYAHQYLDADKFSLFYSNPFDGNPESPKIYFQPINFLFVLLLKAGLDPGLMFSIFGLTLAFCCIYFGVRIIQLLIPGHKHIIPICILFTWGGGLTALAGIASSLYAGVPLNDWTNHIYAADPANGWWGLNWGRTLFIPLEAFYHFLFLLNVYFILKRNWKAAAWGALFLSISHPFTGIEYLSVLFGWLLVEKLVYRNKIIPTWYLAATLVTVLLHIGYYLIYLNQFPEHKQLFSQYSAGWTYSLRVFLPAYILVFLMAILNALREWPLSRLLNQSQQRLFICWALITFLLSKHEWFIRPMQPIHFTRGYIWAGLFLFSIPALVHLLDWCEENRWRKLFLAGFIVLLLADNALWIGNELKAKDKVEWEGYLTDDSKQVFRYLDQNAHPSDLLLGNSYLVNYMANVYSSANSWVSHPYNTPEKNTRIAIMDQFIKSGQRPAEWNGRRLVIVMDKNVPSDSLSKSIKRNVLFENKTYILFTP